MEGAVQKHLATVWEKNKSNKLRTTFSNFSDKVAVRRWHENCCRFATLQWEHQRLDRRLVNVLIRGDAGVMAELRNVVRKKTEVKVIPVVDLSGKSAFQFFFVGAATPLNDDQGKRPMSRPAPRPLPPLPTARLTSSCNSKNITIGWHRLVVEKNGASII